MSDLRGMESELRKIRKALERIADHVDPEGKEEPPKSAYEKRGARFV